MTETYIPIEDLPPDAVQVSALFTNGEKFRKKDALFEVVSCNDKNKTVTLKFVGGFLYSNEDNSK